MRGKSGLARVVTDYADFAWLCDVFVDEAYRGQGLGKRLVQSALAQRARLVRRVRLSRVPEPTMWMELREDRV